LRQELINRTDRGAVLITESGKALLHRDELSSKN